jgi:hypothetical protein
MVFDQNTIYAAKSLGYSLQSKPWFSSVGVSEEEDCPVLIVYLARKPKEDADIPKTWHGIPVILRKVGKLRTLSA